MDQASLYTYGPGMYCNALHFTARHCTALYCTVLFCNVMNCNALYEPVFLHCTVFFPSSWRPKVVVFPCFSTVSSCQRYWKGSLTLILLFWILKLSRKLQDRKRLTWDSVVIVVPKSLLINNNVVRRAVPVKISGSANNMKKFTEQKPIYLEMLTFCWYPSLRLYQVKLKPTVLCKFQIPEIFSPCLVFSINLIERLENKIWPMKLLCWA